MDLAEQKEEVAASVMSGPEKIELVEPSPYQPKEYTIQRPKVTEPVVEEPISRYAPKPQQVLNPAFSTVEEVPVLERYQPKKELHEMK